MLAVNAFPASATAQPRQDEWWFSAWNIQTEVWPVTEGQGVTIALLDSGVNPSVAELSGAAVLPGGDTTGAGTNGLTDFDDANDGHGTSMASLIVAQGGGGSGFIGIAPKARLLSIREPVGSVEVDYNHTLADGIRRAVDQGASVVNMSIGEPTSSYNGTCAPEVNAAIDYAVRHDVALVAGAGDTGRGTNRPEEPASCPGVLAVGAVDAAGNPWPDTQRQPYVAVAAPGYGVGWVAKSGKYYPNGYGTSQAAALTSGAVALIRAHNPTMPARTVVQRLIATALPPTSGRNDQSGYGVIRIGRALDAQKYPVPADAANPVYAALDAAPNRDLPSRGAPSQVRSQTATRSRAAGIGWLGLFGVGVVVSAGVAAAIFVRSRKRRSSFAVSRSAALPPSSNSPERWSQE